MTLNCPECGTGDDALHADWCTCRTALAENGGEVLAKFGHHPEEQIDSDIEVERLQGFVLECHAGLKRALDFRTASPDGLAIKSEVRHILSQTEIVGAWGVSPGDLGEGS